ncbi:MAG: SIS domain-containing protein [Magnetococcales bacterium]|nr:SIS domain-containing protein [Magnetococcales bacterium]
MNNVPSLTQQSGQLDALIHKTVVSDRQQQPMALEAGVQACCDLLADTREKRGQVLIIGNGGSAAVAGHAAIDFLNVDQLRASTLHDAPTLTCISNDYGYENSYAHSLKTLALEGDLLIAISSSGQSANMTNAVAVARQVGCRVMTLSGFKEDNPLRQVGDLNIWLPSSHYGLVEIGHLFVLHHFSERISLKPSTQE